MLVNIKDLYWWTVTIVYISTQFINWLNKFVMFALDKTQSINLLSLIHAEKKKTCTVFPSGFRARWYWKSGCTCGQTPKTNYRSFFQFDWCSRRRNSFKRYAWIKDFRTRVRLAFERWSLFSESYLGLHVLTRAHTRSHAPEILMRGGWEQKEKIGESTFQGCACGGNRSTGKSGNLVFFFFEPTSTKWSEWSDGEERSGPRAKISRFIF